MKVRGIGATSGGAVSVLRLTILFLTVSVNFGLGFQGNLPGYNLDINEQAIDLNAINSSYDDVFLGKMFLPNYMEEFLELLEEAHAADQFYGIVDDTVIKGVASDTCKAHVIDWLLRGLKMLLVTEKDVWVLHMFDAWGKPPEGLFSGHVNALGDFDECVDIDVRNLELHENNIYKDKITDKTLAGRYCNTFFTPYSENRFGFYNIGSAPPLNVFNRFKGNELDEGVSVRKSVTPSKLIELIRLVVGVKILPSMAVCFPKSCSQQDTERVMVNLFENYLYADILSKGGNKSNLVWPGVAFCYEGQKPDLDAADISVIVLLSIILALVAAATIIDIALNRGIDKPPKRSFAHQCLNTFSLYTNIPKWLNTRSTPDDLGCLHGIRFLSTSWIILAHTWYVITFIPYWNLVDVKSIQENWMILTILNSTVSVDTFFMLSGLLVTFNVLKMLQKTKGKLNIPMFYIHRYLRLTPVYAILVGVMATLVPYFGRGPYWFIMDRWAEICVDNWWTNMLYVNNFVNTSWLCQGEAWYLANDMQFYIVSPIFLLPLYHWEMIGLALLGVATLLATLCPALMVYFMETAPTTIGTRDVAKWFTDIYIKPYARIQTYFVGMWLGWILFKTKGKKVKLPMIVVALLWMISTGTCLSVLYGIFPWFDPLKEIPRGAGAVYAGLSRLGWATSVAWIIFACVKGYGWIINDFLSWKAFMPLGRLCYCVYLVSLHLQMILHVQFKQAIGYSNYAMVNFFFAHMVMAFMVGFFFTITIETPFMQLEKLLLEGGGRGSGDKRTAVSGLPNGGASNIKGDGERQGIFYNGNAETPSPSNDGTKQE